MAKIQEAKLSNQNGRIVPGPPTKTFLAAFEDDEERYISDVAGSEEFLDLEESSLMWQLLISSFVHPASPFFSSGGAIAKKGNGVETKDNW